MAQQLGLNVVAEGVETREQLEFLRRHKCNQIQGFLYSKPLSADNFLIWLRQSGNKTTAGPTDNQASA
jgi:sensor c-di-GMP phosphodiesterase-like protein